MKSNYPYNVMMPSSRANDWSRVPRDPISAAIATAVTGATAGAAYTAVYMVSQIAIMAVVSAASSALMPKPDFSSASVNNSGGTLLNQTEAAAFGDIVYGKVRKGGTVTFRETVGTRNKFLHQIITLAYHEVEAIDDIYINDEIISLDSDGWVTNSRFLRKVDDQGRPLEAPFLGQPTIRILKHTGNQTSASSLFSNANTNLAETLHSDTSAESSFVGLGVAYIYAVIRYDQSIFASGVPDITAIVRGKKVATTVNGVLQSPSYTANAAWIIRDRLTSSDGMSVPEVFINSATFEAAAVVCDEQISGTSVGKYEINGIVKHSQKHETVLQDMMTACGGTLYWGTGSWRLNVGDYITPVKTLTLDDVRSNIKINTRVSQQSNFNAVQGTFVDSSSDYITADYPMIKQADFIDEDTPDGEDDRLNVLDLPMPFTTNEKAAQLLAKQTLFRSREQIVINAEFSMEAFDVSVGDFVKFRNERYGWSAGVEKEFEVTGWGLLIDQDSGDLRVALTLKETSEASYGFTDNDAKTIIRNNTTLLKYYEVPSIGVSVSQEYREVNENVVNVLNVEVTTTSIDRLDSVIIQYKKTSDTNYRSIGKSILVAEGDNAGRFEIVGIEVPQINEPAISYTISVTPVNSFGYSGDTVFVTYNAVADNVPPAAPTNLTYLLSGGTIFFQWTASADLDLSHYRLYYTSNTSDAFGSASVLPKVQRIARPATSVTYPALAGKFFVSAIDKTGNESTDAASVVISTSELPTLNETQTHDEHLDATPFSGGLSNITRSGSSIYMSSYSTSGSTGTYTFWHDGVGWFDVGTPRTVRVSYAITNTRKHANAVSGEVTWDDIPGNWDTWPGDWDSWTDETTDFGDTDVQVFCRAANTTADLSSAAWVDASGEVVGRYIQFKAVLSNTGANVTPLVTALSATVEY